MKRLKFLKPHKGKELLCISTREPNYEEMMEKDGDEIIITASLTLNIKTKKGKNWIKDMIEKQNSPLKKYLQEADKELHRQLRETCYTTGEMYKLPNEIKKDLEISDYNDYYRN